MSKLTALSVAVRGSFASILQRLPLNPRGKRIVCLVTLAAKMNNQPHFTKQTRQKLNEVMKLASGDASLVIPYELASVIWEGKSGTEIFHLDPANGELTEDTIRLMVQNACAQMPEWLRYGNADELEHDVGMLLENRTKVFGF